MNDSMIRHWVRTVRRRQRLARAIQYAAFGLFLGGIGSCLVAVLGRWEPLIPWEIFWTMLIATPLLFSGVAAMIGYLWPTPATVAAHRIDRHFQLKNRVLTAWLIARDEPSGAVHLLQQDDARKQLIGSDPRQVVSLRKFRSFLFSLFPALLLAAILLFPQTKQTAIAAREEPNPSIVEVSEILEKEMLRQLEETAKEHPDVPEIKELAETIEVLTEEFQQNLVDRKQSLANLSEIQAALQEAIEAFQLEAMESSLSKTAQGLENVEVYREASDQMKKGDFKEAAKELESADASKMTKSQSKQAAAQLRQAADEMSHAKMSECTDKFADSLEEQEPGKCRQAANQLAQMCRKHAIRKGICQMMNSQIDRLRLCKNKCRGSKACNQDGGTSNHLANRPSERWGKGSADPLGDPTSPLDATREQEQLSGRMGDGPSHKQTLRTESGSATMQRNYREVYQEYQKQAEAVLENEPIPLSHRQTIRRYFERIRPQQAEE